MIGHINNLNFTFEDTGDDIIFTDFYQIEPASEICFLSFHGGVLKILMPTNIDLYLKHIESAVNIKIYKQYSNDPKSVRVTFVSKTGSEFDLGIFYQNEYYDPDQNFFNVVQSLTKIYKFGENGQDVELLKALPTVFTNDKYLLNTNIENFTYNNSGLKIFLINILDDGENIISTNYYLTPASNRSFVSFYGGVFKILLGKDQFAFKSSIQDAIGVEIYLLRHSDDQLVEIVLLFKDGKEASLNIQLVFDTANEKNIEIFDPEFNFDRLSHFRMKFYMNVNNNLVLLNDLPSTFS